MACAAALAVQEVIARDNLLDNVRAMGAHLARRLGERFGNHPHVGDIRGRGLFMGVELVEDRATKAPFDPKRKLHARIKQEAMARGLMVYPMGGTIDGVRGDHVLLAPPFIVDAAAIDAIVERLGDAIDAAVASQRLASIRQIGAQRLSALLPVCLTLVRRPSRPLRASIVAASASTVATAAATDGKNDGLSTEKRRITSASRAKGAAMLSMIASTGTPRRRATLDHKSEFPRIGLEADRHHRLVPVERGQFGLERSAVAAEQRDVVPEHAAEIDQAMGRRAAASEADHTDTSGFFKQGAGAADTSLRRIRRGECPDIGRRRVDRFGEDRVPRRPQHQRVGFRRIGRIARSQPVLERLAQLPPNRRSPDAGPVLRTWSASPASELASTRMETSATSSG